MKELIESATRLYLIAVIGAVALLSNTPQVFARDPGSKSPKPTPTPTPFRQVPPIPSKHESKSEPTDLRGVMDQMKLKEGSNVVSNEGGVKVVAQVKGGQVTGWSATGPNRQSLPTKIERGKGGGGGGKVCRFCYENPYGDWICYVIDCKNAPPPTKK